MRKLKTVFAFEFMGYAKRKSFIVLTAILMVVIGVVLSWPRIKDATGIGSGGASGEKTQQIAVAVQGGTKEDASNLVELLNAKVQDEGFNLQPVEGNKSELEQLINQEEEYDTAILITGPLSYIRIVNTVPMMDTFTKVFDYALLSEFRANELAKAGLSQKEVSTFLTQQVTSETSISENGKDQQQNFFYTYILIFTLYFAVILYGQFVASSVATEKSTRAMELLITSTDINSLLFGKVLGAGFAGILQIVCVLGSGFVFYNLNASFFVENFIVQSIFNMPLSILLYTMLFFILGFFMYAFLFASFASLVSRLEDLGTVILPVTYMFVIAFMVVMFSMASGNVNSVIMIVCSFIPFTSPMAMFTRIAMGNVMAWEIIVSVAILIVSTIAVGLFASSLYRLGVLLYGNAPKPKEIIKMMKNSRKIK